MNEVMRGVGALAAINGVARGGRCHGLLDREPPDARGFTPSRMALLDRIFGTQRGWRIDSGDLITGTSTSSP